MQKVKFLWVSSHLGHLGILPHQALPASSQHLPGSLPEGGQAWGVGRRVPSPRWLLHFPGPRSLMWGCRGCFPVLGARFQGCWAVSAPPGSGQRDHTWQPALGTTWWGLFLGSKAWEWLRLLPGEETGMLFLGPRDTLAPEWGLYQLCVRVTRGDEETRRRWGVCKCEQFKSQHTDTYRKPLPRQRSWMWLSSVHLHVGGNSNIHLGNVGKS